VLVFIDESGDPGFKVAKGSSLLFAAAMVIFESSSTAAETSNAIAELQSRLRIKPEFKFSNCRADVRDEFFRTVANRPFVVRAIVISKEVIYSSHLRSNKDDFYRYFVKSMVKHDGGWLQNAKVIIDGSGDRIFRQDLKTYLRRETPHGCIRDVRFKNSRNDPLVQLADMCVGAIARSYRRDRKDTDRWRRMLRGRLNNVWDFR
jgi:hypothetical protein